MKSYRKVLVLDIPQRRQFVNITREVEAALKESGIREGLALVNAMHITASVFINDDESGLHAASKSGWRISHRKSPTRGTRTTASRTTPTHT